MTPPVLTLTDRPTDSDRNVIGTGLAEFNTQQAGYRDWRPVAALAHDPDTGETIGGMIGRTSYGLLFIDIVYLPKNVRGQNIGATLLQMMEDEGTRRGCTSGFLLTITFQAPSFYARYGWTEFGRIACDPPGTAHVLMTKTLKDA